MRKRAAALLDVDYKALLYKMKKLGIGGNGVKPDPGGPPTLPDEDHYSGRQRFVQGTD